MTGEQSESGGWYGAHRAWERRGLVRGEAAALVDDHRPTSGFGPHDGIVKHISSVPTRSTI